MLRIGSLPKAVSLTVSALPIRHTHERQVFLLKEVFKDICGYEGLYQVSNLGNVKSLSFGAKNMRMSNISKLLKISTTNCGYCKVQLYKSGKPKMCYVHRLVAEAFIPNPENKSQVNHIDGNKLNNVVSNLEWVTASGNQIHAIEHNLRTPSPMIGKFGKLNHNSKPVLQYDLNNMLLKRWDSISDAGRYYGERSNISCCLCGHHRTAYGFIWRYADE